MPYPEALQSTISGLMLWHTITLLTYLFFIMVGIVKGEGSLVINRDSQVFSLFPH